MELVVDLAANVALAEPYTHGKSTVNLRHPVAYAMMLRVPNVVLDTVQPVIHLAVSGPRRIILASILARIGCRAKTTGAATGFADRSRLKQYCLNRSARCEGKRTLD